MVCVCGWLAGWLDDRLSVRPVDVADAISRNPWPPLWLFGQFDQFYIRPNSKFDQISIRRHSQNGISIRSNFQNMICVREVSQSFPNKFGRAYLPIWYGDLVGHLVGHLVCHLVDLQNVVEYLSYFVEHLRRLVESLSIFSGRPRPAGLADW